MIRRLTPGEAAIFRRIRLEALRAEPTAFASSAEDWEALPEAEWERRLIANPVFVSFDGAQPVGIMGLLAQTSGKSAHRGTLVMAYVSASHRRQGRAQALVAAVAGHARSAGLRQLELDVSVENPAAMRLYQRLGFVQVGRIPAGILHAGREIDELMLVLRLTS